MKKVLSLYPIIIGVLFLAFSFVFIRRVPEVNQGVVDRLVPMYQNRPVSQTISPQHDGLNVIMIFLKNRSLINTDKIIFTLSENEKVIRTIELSGSNIGDGDTVRFQFDPIPDSAGHTYSLRLEAPATQVSQTPIEVGFSNTDTYTLGSSPEPGDMSFQLFYKPVNKAAYISELATIFVSRLTPLYGISVLISLFVCFRLVKLLK